MLTVSESPSVDAVMAAVNLRRRSSWRLVAPLSHGVNQGAFHVTDANGQEAVLKFGRNAGPPGSALSGPWGRGLRRVAPILRKARRRGWPAPAFIAFGEADGFTYLLREWVAGEPVLTVGCDDRVLTGILEIVEFQAGLAPAGRHDWSAHAAQVLHDPRWEGLQVLRDRSPATQHLVEKAKGLAQTLRAVRLPRGDLVHGDFNFANLIVRDDGGVAVLDMEQAGRGTRAYDLATLLMVAGWPGDELAEPMQRHIREAGEAVAGPEVLAFCLAAVVLDWTRFGLTPWTAEGVDRFAAHWSERLDAP